MKNIETDHATVTHLSEKVLSMIAILLKEGAGTQKQLTSGGCDLRAHQQYLY